MNKGRSEQKIQGDGGSERDKGLWWKRKEDLKRILFK